MLTINFNLGDIIPDYYSSKAPESVFRKQFGLTVYTDFKFTKKKLDLSAL